MGGKPLPSAINCWDAVWGMGGRPLPSANTACWFDIAPKCGSVANGAESRVVALTRSTARAVMKRYFIFRFSLWD
jgi:hypothetical protein